MDATYHPGDDIFSVIIRCYQKFTRSERKLADFILSHKEICPSLNISELASACQVSDATVSRFFHSLGCTNFNEFRLAAVHALSAMENQPVNYDQYNGLSPADPIDQKAQKLCNVGILTLQQTLSLLDFDRIQAAVELFSNARAIYCFGQGNSSIVAEDAWGRFTCISPKFHYISNTRLQASTAEKLTDHDVIFYFSFSGAVAELEEIGQITQRNGAKLVLMTRFPNSIGAQYADLVLLCGANEAPYQQGSIAAKIGQLFIVDVLFHEYCARNGITLEKSEFQRS